MIQKHLREEHAPGDDTAPRSILKSTDLLFSALIAAAFFLLLLTSPNIPGGDDAYRHVKFASRLIHDPGDALSQPWKLLYFWPKPVDAWFGYHLLLAPLTLAFDLIRSAKILAALVYGAQTLVLLSILKEAGVLYRKAWVLLAIAGSGMALWRATLSRPFLFSIVLVLAATYFTIRRNRLGAGLVSALHAFSYSMFFMAAFAPLVNLALRRDRNSARLVAATFGGMIAGLVLNPTVPENLRFDVAQAFAPVTFGSRLIMEHLPLSMEMINPAWPLLLAWLCALVRAVWLWRKQRLASLPPAAFLLLAMSLACFVGSLAIGRIFDYFIPLAALSAAAILSPWTVETRRHRMDAAAAATIVAILCGSNLVSAVQAVRETPPAGRFQGVSEYLLSHGKGAIVFNTQWEQYPFLYFWNSESTYIVGIDPSFFLRRDQRRYWLWRHIANQDAVTCGGAKCDGAESKDLHQVIAGEFGAGFVVVEHDKNQRLDQMLRSRQGFREVYRDKACALFEVSNDIGPRG